MFSIVKPLNVFEGKYHTYRFTAKHRYLSHTTTYKKALETAVLQSSRIKTSNNLACSWAGFIQRYVSVSLTRNAGLLKVRKEWSEASHTIITDQLSDQTILIFRQF